MQRHSIFHIRPDDWVQDTRSLSLEAKGAWIDILCIVGCSPHKGALKLPLAGWARMLGCTEDQAAIVITELEDSELLNSNLDEDPAVVSIMLY